MNRLRVTVVSAGIGARHVAGFNAVPGLFQAAVINSLGWLVSFSKAGFSDASQCSSAINRRLYADAGFSPTVPVGPFRFRPSSFSPSGLICPFGFMWR